MQSTLEALIGPALRTRGWTLATAESCTGGLLGHRITDVPGASDYFAGGLIAYSYEAKQVMLEVDPQELLQHGAVSRETALAMARGARRVLGSDLALSITGIAGPGGGMPEKPVGLTWVAAITEQVELCERHEWHGDRASNKAQSVDAALALALKLLQSHS